MKQLLVRNDWPVWFYFNVHYNPTSYKRDIPIKGDYIFINALFKYLNNELKYCENSVGY